MHRFASCLRVVLALPLVLCCSSTPASSPVDGAPPKGQDGETRRPDGSLDAAKDAGVGHEHDARTQDATRKDARTQDAGSTDASSGDGASHCTGKLALPLTSTPNGFVDVHGCPAVLHGIDIFLDFDVEYGNQSPETIAQKVAADGFNFARLPIFWSEFEPNPPTVSGGVVTHDWEAGAPTMNEYIALVSALTAQGIPVVPDMQQDTTGIPNWLFGCTPVLPDGGNNCWTPDHRCAFFNNSPDAGGPILPSDALHDAWTHLMSVTLAQGAQVIGLDVLNEPETNGSCSGFDAGTVLDHFFVDTTRRLRGWEVEAGVPGPLFVIEDVGYAAYCRNDNRLDLTPGLSVELADAGVPEDRWVYSWHFYPQTFDAAAQPLSDHIARAKQYGVAFWLGEFDPRVAVSSPEAGCADHLGSANIPWKETLENELGNPDAGTTGFFQAAGLSWSYWAYTGSLPQGSLVWDAGDPTGDLLRTLQWGMKSGQ
jgi:Cellulase (glycosyl hydrolase family 5)